MVDADWRLLRWGTSTEADGSKVQGSQGPINGFKVGSLLSGRLLSKESLVAKSSMAAHGRFALDRVGSGARIRIFVGVRKNVNESACIGGLPVKTMHAMSLHGKMGLGEMLHDGYPPRFADATKNLIAAIVPVAKEILILV
ncbi:hypothetical protein NE237_018335 [Protea cynaroides]|uniref:Uncharacterized protein n=1 Tax=Protea cynaroides TaxID=273540 RepID=A0A9Q0K9V3_9MAGN|nr:hypothetical protein NE237_018335 [Protea cynaroides]